MCRQLEKLIAREKQEASTETSAETTVNHVNSLMRKNSLEEACDMLDITVEQYLAAKKHLEENTSK